MSERHTTRPLTEAQATSKMQHPLWNSIIERLTSLGIYTLDEAASADASIWVCNHASVTLLEAVAAASDHRLDHKTVLKLGEELAPRLLAAWKEKGDIQFVLDRLGLSLPPSHIFLVLTDLTTHPGSAPASEPPMVQELGKQTSSEAGETLVHTLRAGLIAKHVVATLKSWDTTYLGNAVDRLQAVVQSYTDEKHGNLYNKTMSIIQSSGTGKSRVVHELSERILTVPFQLEEDKAVAGTSFPPSYAYDFECGSCVHQAVFFRSQTRQSGTFSLAP